MPLSVVGAVAMNTTTNVAAVALPALPTVQDGDKLLALWTSNGSTATINTDPALTPLDALTAVGTVSQVRPYYKDLTAAGDTGAVFTLTWSVNVKGSAVGLIIRGAALGAPDAIGGPQTDSGADAQLTLPGITPVAADCLLCALAGTQHTTSGGVTATGAWVEQADSVGTTATPLSGVWAGTKQLTGQAGVAQASEDMTYALDGRDGSWVFSLAPLATGQTIAPIGDVSSDAANLVPWDPATVEAIVGKWLPAGTVPPTLARSVVRAYEGSESLLITWGAGGSFPAATLDVHGLTVGAQYTASVQVWVPTGSPDVVLAVGGIGFGSNVSTKNAWTVATITFTATAGTASLQLWPATSPAGGEQVWLDAAKLQTGASATAFTSTPDYWVATGGNGDRASTMDEAAADDSDYATSPLLPVGSSMEVKLGPATDPLSSSGHVLSYRCRVNNADTHSVVVALYQGSTLIASVTCTNLTSAFVTGTLTLTGTEADSITDYNDLRVRITATAS